MTWDPNQYLKYEALRARPIIDLLKRVDKREVRSVLDLGCGTGTAFPILRRRWPKAHITAVDKSVEMLKHARAKADDINLVHADIADFEPDGPVDVVLSNAALHWMDDHESLLLRLMNMLKPGGVLAVQMPNNWDEPSHTCLFDLACSEPWAQKLAPLVRRKPVLEADDYHRILAPVTGHLSVHESLYIHALKGENPTLEWMRGTTLRPYMKVLNDAEWPDFELAYGTALENNYPSDKTGLTLFRFKRLMIVAHHPLD